MNFDQIVTELEFSTARSGGSGGQRANKVETKVIVKFRILDSNGLSLEEKKHVLERLSSKINSEGALLLAYGRSRSQAKNKKTVIQILETYLRKALKKDPKSQK